MPALQCLLQCTLHLQHFKLCFFLCILGCCTSAEVGSIGHMHLDFEVHGICRDNTISRLEAELSSVKKENDDLRQETRWTLDQVQHRIAQLEAQNAFYADVISTDRAKAEKTKIQLYHTVSPFGLCMVLLGLLCADDVLTMCKGKDRFTQPGCVL